MSIKNLNIPERLRKPLKEFTGTFEKSGFDCYLVGGCVRDLLLGHDTYDYDFATNARPEQVMKLFRRVAPTGIKHGTVTVLFAGMEFEVTTYRADGRYLDGRRPESISFSDTLQEDVLRRDFTINGLAYDMKKDEIIDLVGGIDDLDRCIIKTIGSPLDRFGEDGLRTYRACRFSAKLGFEIEISTFNAISKTLDVAEKVSAERIREELMKLLAADTPSRGFEYMRRSGLMKLSLPELDACYEIEQNRFHAYDIYYHSLYSCDAAPKDKPLVRLSALLHDIGKVSTRKQTEEGEYTFYNHEVIGARMVRKLMKRLKFSNSEIEIVNNLVINHMFHYTDDWSDGAVRRFMRKVGVENIPDLFELREADRIGNGTRTGLPEPIKKLQERIDAVIEAENAITVRDLRINGNIIMEKFDLKPGPLVGRILHELLEMVLDEPEMNKENLLIEKAEEIYSNLKNEAEG
ncbi:MAG TPA: CCA tRNA nucleotidyltransferase [Spirochaetota bacterium]|nr:CCA tRNA nucleotidyltransferase [Spirochaetota bacterium]HPF05151.1 CCA tRNA nucleotidyltransferase [Spirochaetota bacterium]HPJ42573.1 CCA tRNA nucleotidyltransferase [Spirochaetota bacterium]HPR36264.1 CCA tRNA nucleotidyltransferase [Spirochaetota bacterium]HRX47249.1 CCA tRNA nucleotidyltransferase [Spirochaetota bacterium]